jgi:O-antigen ligase
MPGADPRPFRRSLLWLVLPLLAAALVVFDPILGDILAPVMRRNMAEAGGALPLAAVLVPVGGALGLILTRVTRNSDFATLAMAALLIASQLNGFGFGPLDVFDVTLFAVFVAWAATLALDETRQVRLGFLASIAFLFGALAVAHMPVMRPVPWVVGMIGVLRISLIALLVVDLCRDIQTIERAFRIYLGVAVASAVVGILQFALGNLGIYVFTLIHPAESAFKPTPIGFLLRASGFCITAQHFSSFLVYILPFALWRASQRPKFWRMFAVLVLLAGVLVSWNTGAIFAAALVVMVFPFLRWPDRAVVLLIAFAALVSAAYYSGLMQAVYDATFGDAGVAKGVDQRKTLMELGIEQISASPLIGTGLRGFGSVDGNFWHRPVHNIFGQAAAELGLFGFLLIFAVFAVFAFQLVARLNEGAAHYTLRIAFISLLAALMLGQSEPNLDQSNFWLLLGLIQATLASRQPPKPCGPHGDVCQPSA